MASETSMDDILWIGELNVVEGRIEVGKDQIAERGEKEHNIHDCEDATSSECQYRHGQGLDQPILVTSPHSRIIK